MFYRVTTLHFDENRFDELIAWSETIRSTVEGIPGLEFADIARTGPGEGVVLGAYSDEAAYVASADVVASVLAGMAEFLMEGSETLSGPSVAVFRGSALPH